MLRKPFNLDIESHKLSRNQRLKYSLALAARRAGDLRRINFHKSDQTMNMANQGSNLRASSSGLGESSGISGDDNSRRGSLFITLTPKLKKILGINSISPNPNRAREQEPRSQSACSGCFSSRASSTSSSGSTASLPSKATKSAEKSARKKREQNAKKLEEERKKREKAEQKRLKADQKGNPSPGDQLPPDSEIREYFFHYKKRLSNKPPVTRQFDAAQVRAAAASFEAATANSAIADAIAGPSSRPFSRLSQDYGKIYMGSPRNSPPPSILGNYAKYNEDEESSGGNLISTKFTSFKKD